MVITTIDRITPGLILLHLVVMQWLLELQQALPKPERA